MLMEQGFYHIFNHLHVPSFPAVVSWNDRVISPPTAPKKPLAGGGGKGYYTGSRFLLIWSGRLGKGQNGSAEH